MNLLDILALETSPARIMTLTDREARALAYMIRGLAERNDPALERYTARAREHGLDVDQILRTAHRAGAV